MDPLTQGVLGAVAAQLPADKNNIARASLLGALAGMAPDLDVLIRSANDSLLALEYHRHFTHSLLFIPIGGPLCGVLFYALLNKVCRISFRQCLLWSALGFATHGLLDACTSYGTRLLWPLSDARIAWDLVSVIDPVFSLVLVVLMIATIVWRQKRLAAVSLAWIGLYFSAAFIQHERAIFQAEQLAVKRGHPIDGLHAKPSFGNIVVWKSIYASGDTYYVDAIRPGVFGPEIWPGDSVKQLNIERDLPWLNPASQQAKDIERFRHFSTGFVALDPDHPNRIGDVRYSQLPQAIKPLWGIEVSPTAGPAQHAVYVTDRSGSRDDMTQLLNMIFYGHPNRH